MSICHYTGALRRGDSDPRWALGFPQLRSKIKSHLLENDCTAVVGSLASGGDLEVVSIAHEMNIPIHAFLPFAVEDFVVKSVACGGYEEVHRFKSMLAKVKSLQIVHDSPSSDEDLSYRQTSQMAMQAARSMAKRANVTSWQLALWDGIRMETPGTGADIANWQASGQLCRIVYLPSLIEKDSGPMPSELSETIIFGTKLGYELHQAWKAACHDLPEASVMHCCRIQEGVVLLACNLIKLRLARLENFFAINELAAARQLPRPAFLVAQQLRHTGNAVRHLQRPLGNHEHWVCLSLIRKLLIWFSTGFSEGPVLAPTEFPISPHDELIDALVELNDSESFSTIKEEIFELTEAAPGIALLACERAIDLRCWTIADECIRRLQRMNLLRRRLLELEALMASRRGNPELAIKLLKPIPLRQFDIETPGIVAGAYKRLWLRDSSEKHLQQAYKLYGLSWRKTGDTYVGINAAACSAWVGNIETGKQIAQQVITRLTRLSQLWPRGREQTPAWDFWSLATMAEALWLAGRLEESAEWERQAHEMGMRDGSPVEVFQKQMELHRSL